MYRTYRSELQKYLCTELFIGFGGGLRCISLLSITKIFSFKIFLFWYWSRFNSTHWNPRSPSVRSERWSGTGQPSYWLDVLRVIGDSTIGFPRLHSRERIPYSPVHFCKSFDGPSFLISDLTLTTHPFYSLTFSYIDRLLLVFS